jgi:hypothetical protein
LKTCRHSWRSEEPVLVRRAADIGVDRRLR